MILYIHTKCTTCQKALSFLEKRKTPVEIRDIVKTPPTLEELTTMLAHHKGNVRKLFNTSGQLYREMQLSEKLDTMPTEESLNLLHTHGMLVKRPFLIKEDKGLVGFNESAWSEI